MLLAFVALTLLAPKTIILIPKETVWVYANASTPTDGSYLRAWGVEGKSCPAEGEDPGEFSYSYLKWDLSDVPKDAKLVSAKLELSNIPDPGFSLDAAKKSPLEVRELVGEFDAKTWTYELAARVRPASAKTAIFGSGSPKAVAPGMPVAITIDLLAGPNSFSKTLRTALSSTSHQLSVSITSSLDPSVDGRTSVYKVYGQNESHESLRPKLVLTFD